jgi:MEMO1 family protein
MNSSTSSSTIRHPVVAGRFYPDSPQACQADAQDYLTRKPAQPGDWIGAVAPHAGWVCSGAIAARAIASLAPKADLIVVFGAVHSPFRFDFGALDSHAVWKMPLGNCALPVDFEQHLLEQGNVFGVEPRVHQHEHAIEVLIPFLQVAFPDVPVVPIEVPPTASAGLIGRKTAQIIQREGLKARYIASTDLTHYGRNYSFCPAGVGPSAMAWAKENDHSLIEMMLLFQVDAIVQEAQKKQNACGPGAVAALLAACRENGAQRAFLLEHATSYETLASVAPQPPVNSVGYASVMVG